MMIITGELRTGLVSENYKERINRKMKTIMLVFGTRPEAIKE